MAIWEKWKEKWGVETDKRMIWIFVIFAITGSSIARVRRPIQEWVFGTDQFSELTWYAMIAIIILMYVIYQIFLFVIGSVLGEHKFVKWFVIKMNKRIFPFLGKENG